MRPKGCICCVCFVAATATLARAQSIRADDAPALLRAESPNGRFALSIRAAHPGGPDKCEAELRDLRAEDGAEAARWKAALVNDTAPVAAFVRNDGRYVVTLDEHRLGGARNALVIYGDRGQLLRHFILSDLLAGDDWSHVQVRRRALVWRDNRAGAFDVAADEFVLELPWGKTIRVDLEKLQIVSADANRDQSAQQIPREILAALFGNSAPDPRDRALREMAERTGMSVEELEKLAALGYLKIDTTGVPPRTPPDVEPTSAGEMEVDPAAPRPAGTEESSGPAAQLHLKRDAGNRETSAAWQEEVLTPDAPLDGRPRDHAPGSPVAETSELLPREYRAQSTAGMEIPLPDPGQPVDYVAWLNRQTDTSGLNAAPLYEDAIARYIPPEDGIKRKLAAAVDGNQEALFDPQLRSWLDSNREALRQFREATRLDFAGFRLESPTGDLFGAVLPNLSPMRDLSRAVIVEAQRLAADEKHQLAVELLLDALTAGAHAGSGPTMIETLVGRSIQSEAAGALWSLLARDRGARVDLERLASELPRVYSPVRPMAQAVQFERAVFLDSTQRVFARDPEGGKLRADPRKAREYARMVGGTDEEIEALANQLSTLDFARTIGEANAYYDAITEAVSLPYPEGRPILERVMQARSGNEVNPLLKVLAPDLTAVHETVTAAEATRRSTLLCATLLAYARKNGGFPDSLTSLGDSAFVIDPFSNSALSYRRDGDGFLLSGGRGEWKVATVATGRNAEHAAESEGALSPLQRE